MKSSKQWVPLSLALLISGIGFGTIIPAAEAKPPDWAPAWGYRCKESGKSNRQADCKRDARYERNERYDDDDDRYDDEDRYSRRGVLESGTYLETDYSGRDRIVLRRNEVLPLTLRVAEDVEDDDGRVLIRRGSRIEGELRPSDGGVRFYARRLILTSGGRYSINARSNVIRNSQDFDDDDLDDTVVSRAARILIGSVLGSQGDLGDILGDVLEGRTRGDSRLRSDLVVVYPDRDLDLRLRSDLRIR